MTTTLGKLGSGTFGAFSSQDLAPKKAEPTKSLDEQLVESATAKGGLEKAQTEQQAKTSAEMAAGEKGLSETYAKSMAEDPTRALVGQKTQERADMKFVPTQETVQDLGTLFTITNLLGFMIGGKSKGNAQAAMSAMNGMLEGHQKGRADVYKKEKDIFDENIKTLDKTIDSLHKKMQDDLQLYSTNRDAGMAALRDTVAQHNATFIKDAMEKYGPAYAYDKVKSLVEMRDKQRVAQANLDEKERTRISREEDKKRDRELRIQLAQIAAEAKQSKQQGQESNLGTPDINEVYQMGVPLAIQNPYRGLNDKLKGQAFTSELRKAETEFQANAAATNKARNTINDMTEADDILKRIPTGGLARLPFGGDIQTAFSSDAARFDSIAKNQARNAYVKGEGALSDTERKMFEKSSISLGNPTATNQQIIGVTKEVAKRAVEHNEYLERYFGANKTLMGAEESWNRYLNNNPLFAPGSTEKNLKLNPDRMPYTQYFQDEIRRAASSGQ